MSRMRSPELVTLEDIMEFDLDCNPIDQNGRRMYAERGDRLVVHSHVGLTGREAEILEVAHEDGSPPYRVRWSDTGHEALVFPGPDAHVQHVSHERADSTEERHP